MSKQEEMERAWAQHEASSQRKKEEDWNRAEKVLKGK